MHIAGRLFVSEFIISQSGREIRSRARVWEILNILEMTPNISANGTTLYPSVYIEAMKTSGEISGTIHLEKYSSGKWVSVNSCGISGTDYVLLSKNYREYQ